MAVLNRTYYLTSKLVATSGTTALPVLYIAPTATNDLVICKIRFSVEATSTQSASPSTNNSILATLNTVTGTVGGGGSVTPAQTSGTALAANTVFTSANAAAITGLTQSTEIWGGPVALSAGAWSADDETNTGLEIPLAASSKTCFYITTASGAGSNLSVAVRLWFTE